MPANPSDNPWYRRLCLCEAGLRLTILGPVGKLTDLSNWNAKPCLEVVCAFRNLHFLIGATAKVRPVVDDCHRGSGRKHS